MTAGTDYFDGRVWHDEAEYAHCSAPHASVLDAEAALVAFVEGVGQLRRRLGIADVALAAEAVLPDGSRVRAARAMGDNTTCIRAMAGGLQSIMELVGVWDEKPAESTALDEMPR